MACNHPKESWVGLADGIHCGQCGALVNLDAPKAKPELKVEKDPEPEKKPAAKRGGKK